jgi:hypothetical protein
LLMRLSRVTAAPITTGSMDTTTLPKRSSGL